MDVAPVATHACGQPRTAPHARQHRERDCRIDSARACRCACVTISPLWRTVRLVRWAEGGGPPLRLGGLVVVRAEAVAEQGLHGARFRRVVVGEAEAPAADVPDGRAAEDPDDLRRRAAVVRHGQHVCHCSTQHGLARLAASGERAAASERTRQTNIDEVQAPQAPHDVGHRLAAGCTHELGMQAPQLSPVGTECMHAVATGTRARGAGCGTLRLRG